MIRREGVAGPASERAPTRSRRENSDATALSATRHREVRGAGAMVRRHAGGTRQRATDRRDPR